MPSHRSLAIMALMIAMDLVAGFALILGTGILSLTDLGNNLFWGMLPCAAAGLAAGLLVAIFGPGYPWNRIASLGFAVPASAVPAWLLSGGVFKGVVTGLLLSAAYWRGLAATQELPTYAEVQARFGIGFAVYFLGVIAVVARGIVFEGSVWHLLALTGIGYTVLAMIALGTARMEGTREPGSGASIVLAIGLQLALLLGVALGVLQLLSFDMVGAALHATRPLWDAIGSAGYGIAMLAAHPIQSVIDLLRPGQRPPRTIGPTPPGIRTGGPSGHLKKPLRPVHPNDIGITVVLVLIGALLVAAAGYLVWRTTPRVPHLRRQRGYTEERRSTWSAVGMWTSIVAFIRGLFKRGSRVAEVAVRESRRRIFGDYPDDPVRRVYTQLLRRSAASGLPRGADTTPFEFLALLKRRWPMGAGHFEALTEAYVDRRYGEIESDSVQMTQLRRHWHGARPVMRLSVVAVAARAASGNPSAPGTQAPESGAWRRMSESIARPLMGEALGLALAFAAPIVLVLIVIILLKVLASV